MTTPSALHAALQAPLDPAGHPLPQRPIVALEQVSKSYLGVPALSEVSLSIAPGEVRALCGANGAGKSTIVKIIAGVETPDTGRVIIDGATAAHHTPGRASQLGLQFIHQELNLVPKFTAAQNMGLGYAGGSRACLVDRRRIRRRAQQVLDDLDAKVPLDTEVDRLTVSQRWLVSLGRALMNDARLVVMDEPTASFGDDEVAHLHAVIGDLRARGVALLYISHRLEEVLRISTRITVLREGTVVGHFPTRDLDQAELTRHIIGHTVTAADRSATAQASGDPVLELHGIARPPRVRDVTLAVRSGQILGMAGLVGAGRTEVARLIAGAETPTRGEMALEGRPYRPASPSDAIGAGIALLPEERRSEGLLLNESVAANMSLASLRQHRNRWTRLVSTGQSRDAAAAAIRQLGIKATSPAQPVGTLSGGNQQKVLLARYLRTKPKVLILDEPTIGIDIGARAELYDLIAQLASEGTAIIVISSDFDELAICHEVAVMREGRVVRVIDAAEATKARLTALCYEASDASHQGGGPS